MGCLDIFSTSHCDLQTLMDVVFEYFPVHTSLPSLITSSHVLPHVTNAIFLTSSICTLFSLPGMCSLQYFFLLHSCHHSCPNLNTPPLRYLAQLVSIKYSANCQQIHPFLCLISFGALKNSEIILLLCPCTYFLFFYKTV